MRLFLRLDLLESTGVSGAASPRGGAAVPAGADELSETKLLGTRRLQGLELQNSLFVFRQSNFCSFWGPEGTKNKTDYNALAAQPTLNGNWGKGGLLIRFSWHTQHLPAELLSHFIPAFNPFSLSATLSFRCLISPGAVLTNV